MALRYFTSIFLLPYDKMTRAERVLRDLLGGLESETTILPGIPRLGRPTRRQKIWGKYEVFPVIA